MMLATSQDAASYSTGDLANVVDDVYWWIIQDYTVQSPYQMVTFAPR